MFVRRHCAFLLTLYSLYNSLICSRHLSPWNNWTSAVSCAWRTLSEMRIRGPIWATKHTIREHRTTTKLRIHNSSYIVEPTSKGVYISFRRATHRAQRQLVAGLVQHCSKGGATYHLRYPNNITVLRWVIPLRFNYVTNTEGAHVCQSCFLSLMPFFIYHWHRW